MAITILITLSLWAAFTSFVVVDQVGKPRKPLTPRLAAKATAVHALQIVAYVYLIGSLK